MLSHLLEIVILVFFFVKKKDVEKKKEKLNLSDTDKKRIEKDVYDIMGSKIDKDKPIVLDLESINVVKPGKYELDLVNLFKKSPLVYKLEEGKYVVDLLQKFDEDSKKD